MPNQTVQVTLVFITAVFMEFAMSHDLSRSTRLPLVNASQGIVALFVK